MKKANAGNAVIVAIIAIIIVVAIFIMVLGKNETQEETQENTELNTSVENNTINSEEGKEENESESVAPESQEIEEGSVATESEKTALDLAKEYRGVDDDSVYYTIDSENGDKIIVAARDKDTTETVMFYEVDLKTKEVKEQ